MALRQGVDALRESIDRAKSGGGSRTPTNWLAWEDGETKCLRFLTDVSQIFVLGMHDYVQCADGKRRTFVCRRELDADCELCGREDIRKREMGWGLAALRREVRQEVDGRSRIVNYEDVTEEITIDGQKKIAPHVGIVRQAPTNFWIQIDGIAEKYGSLLDRDIDIVRRGGDKSTVYMAYPCDPVEIPNVQERYAAYTPDLKALLEAMGSPEYYAQHLHGVQRERSGGGGGGASAPVTHSSAPTEELDEQSEFERLKAEVNATPQATGQAYS